MTQRRATRRMPGRAPVPAAPAVRARRGGRAANLDGSARGLADGASLSRSGDWRDATTRCERPADPKRAPSSGEHAGTSESVPRMPSRLAASVPSTSPSLSSIPAKITAAPAARSHIRFPSQDAGQEGVPWVGLVLGALVVAALVYGLLVH